MFSLLLLYNNFSNKNQLNCVHTVEIRLNLLRMQRKPSPDKREKMYRESSSTIQTDNSLEVISGGKLADIARPALSSSSTRSLSQLSMQGTSVLSFELESLPDDYSSLKVTDEDELYIEEAVVDYDDDCDVEFQDDLLQLATTNIAPSSPNEVGGSEDVSSPDINSKEFEKEIFKMSKRFNKTKKLRAKPNLVEEVNPNSSPAPSATQPQSRNSYVENASSDQEADPKISRGMEKIKKLDEILAEKVKLEKETKAERKRLEKEWQLEIKGFVEWCGEKKSKPIIQQFLALTHEISDPHPLDNDEDEVEPLFQTEIQAEVCDTSSNNNEMIGNGGGINKKGESVGGHSSSQFDESTEPKEGRKESLHTGKNGKSRKKDFIKRNIVLAAHANEVVSLTESEKLRLDELLSDDSDLLLIENPFSKNDHHKAPSGYELDESAKKALTDIDEKLKWLVPQSDFQSICFSPVSDDQLLTGRTSNSNDNSKAVEDVSGVKYGDGILKQEKHYREMQHRLQQIEAELKKIGQLEEADSELNTPTISHDLLQQLIEVDSRLTSSALSILDSARSNLSTARTDASKETFVASLDGTSCLDSSRTPLVEKSFHDVGV